MNLKTQDHGAWPHWIPNTCFVPEWQSGQRLVDLLLAMAADHGLLASDLQPRAQPGSRNRELA
jgi:hypothetical protein